MLAICGSVYELDQAAGMNLKNYSVNTMTLDCESQEDIYGDPAESAVLSSLRKRHVLLNQENRNESQSARWDQITILRKTIGVEMKLIRPKRHPTSSLHPTVPTPCPKHRNPVIALAGNSRQKVKPELRCQAQPGNSITSETELRRRRRARQKPSRDPLILDSIPPNRPPNLCAAPYNQTIPHNGLELVQASGYRSPDLEGVCLYLLSQLTKLSAVVRLTDVIFYKQPRLSRPLHRARPAPPFLPRGKPPPPPPPPPHHISLLPRS